MITMQKWEFIFPFQLCKLSTNFDSLIADLNRDYSIGYINEYIFIFRSWGVDYTGLR